MAATAAPLPGPAVGGLNASVERLADALAGFTLQAQALPRAAALPLELAKAPATAAATAGGLLGNVGSLLQAMQHYEANRRAENLGGALSVAHSAPSTHALQAPTDILAQGK